MSSSVATSLMRCANGRGIINEKFLDVES